MSAALAERNTSIELFSQAVARGRPCNRAETITIGFNLRTCDRQELHFPKGRRSRPPASRFSLSLVVLLVRSSSCQHPLFCRFAPLLHDLDLPCSISNHITPTGRQRHSVAHPSCQVAPNDEAETFRGECARRFLDHSVKAVEQLKGGQVHQVQLIVGGPWSQPRWRSPPDRVSRRPHSLRPLSAPLPTCFASQRKSSHERERTYWRSPA